jgi:hypothetical protein
MSKVTPEVLAAITKTREAFRARGRPLPSDAVDDLAHAWLEAWREIDATAETPEALWAAAELEDLHRSEPESALAVLGRALDLAPGLDTEFLSFEELRTLLRVQPAFAQSRLPAFLEAYPSLRARIVQLCARGETPPDWPVEIFAQLCATVAP